jgi:hypothetical protein
MSGRVRNSDAYNQNFFVSEWLNTPNTHSLPKQNMLQAFDIPQQSQVLCGEFPILTRLLFLATIGGVIDHEMDQFSMAELVAFSLPHKVATHS